MKRIFIVTLIATSACYPTTTRPIIAPNPSAQVSEVELSVPAAMRAMALALDGDSIPVRRTEPKDGWLETDWFDAATLKPSMGRVLGDGIVKVRAWADPSRPNHSNITVETVFRPMDDPSRDPRSLERQVPPEHPVARRVVGALNQVIKQYGEPADTIKTEVPAPVVKQPTGHL